jgi:hypothetical protein
MNRKTLILKGRIHYLLEKEVIRGLAYFRGELVAIANSLSLLPQLYNHQGKELTSASNTN